MNCLQKNEYLGGWSFLSLCIYISIYLWGKGGTGEGLQEQETGGRGTRNEGEVSLRTPHPKRTEGEKIPKKLGTEGTKTTPPP